MKILHIATGFPISFPGGITNYVRALARAQVADGHDVHILSGPGVDHAAIPAGVTVHEYTSCKIRPFTFGIHQKDPSSVALRKNLLSAGYSIIHIHMALNFDMNFFEALTKCEIPYVISIHDYFFICPRIFMVDYSGRRVCKSVDLERCSECIGVLDQMDLLTRIIRRINRTLPGNFTLVPPRIRSRVIYSRAAVMKSFLENARMILPVSSRVKNIVSTAVPGGRYQVEHIGNESALTQKQNKLPSDKIRFVFMGVLNFMKGAEILAELVSRVKRHDVEFHFYGRADSRYEKLLTSKGLICHGSYKPSQLDEILSHADVGMVLPVWEDNGPQVVMEFLNHGTPVLGTKRGGIPDFVNKGTGLLFDPAAPEDIDQAVAWIENVTQADIAAMVARIKPLMTPEEHAARMKTVYEQILGIDSRQS